MSEWPQILCDLYATDEDGEPLGVAVECVRSQSHELKVKVGDTGIEPKVQINCSLVNGQLFIDVIDVARLELDDEPCGALAVASAKVPVTHDDLVWEDMAA